MSKVFIGGSRRISRLDEQVRRRIRRIVEKRLPVLVGDASGADKAVQEYLRGEGYDLVEVFCSGESCRNNVGGWPVRAVPVSGKRRGFAFYATKDRAMAEDAAFGLMLWDGESVGTLMNVLRLVRSHKRVVVYVQPDGESVDIMSDEDWKRLVGRCTPDLRERVEREASAERRMNEGKPSAVQADLF